MIITEGNVTYFPRISIDGKTVYRKEAFAVRLPTAYDPAKNYPLMVLVHGIGERAAGTLENLKNLVLGFDYDGDGPLGRQYALLSEGCKTALDKEGVICAVVNYQNEMDPAGVDFVFNEVEKAFPIDKFREILVGFSLGGKIVTRYASSSLMYADRLALLVACAPVNGMTNYANIVNASLQVIFTSAATDPVVSPGNAKTMLAGINNLNPAIKAVYYEAPGSGHGTLNEVISADPNFLPQSIYSYVKLNPASAPKQYPTTKTSPGGVDPGAETPVSAIASVTQDGSRYRMDGTKSIGAKYYTWTVKSAPPGVNIYAPMMSNGGASTTFFTPPAVGIYSIEFAAYASSTNKSTQLISINYGGVTEEPKPMPVNFIWPDKLVLSDGNILTVSAKFTDQNGTVY